MNRSWIVIVFLMFVTVPACAQDFQQGFAPYQSYDVNSLDSINLSNGNLVVHIPVISYPQRGTLPDVGYSLIYNNATWSSMCSDVGYGDITSCSIIPATSVNLVTNEVNGGGVVGSLNYGLITTGGPVVDATGAFHGALSTTSSYWPLETTDATGMKLTESGSGFFASNYFVTDANGITSKSQFACSGCYADVLTQIQDPTGTNTVTLNYDSGPNEQLTSISDSVGRSIPPFPATASAGCVTQDFPVVGGTTAAYEACYSSHTLDSDMGLTSMGLADYTGSVVMLDYVVLPNLTRWTFTYDDYGDLAAITLPTGGQIRYTWSIPSWTYYFLYSEAPYTIARQISSRIIDPNPPSTGNTWTYSFSDYNYTVTTVTDQNLEETVHTFGYGDDFETETNYYADTGTTLLQTVDRTFFGYPTSYPYMDIVPKTVQTTWHASGQVSEDCYIYDDNTDTSCTGTDAFNSSGPTFYNYGSPLPLVYGSQLYKYEYDYGSGSPGSLSRQTLTNYLWGSSSSYLNANLLTFPSSVVVEDGSGTMWKQTTYAYDESGYAPSGCSPSTPCGLTTTTNNYITSSTSATSHADYNSNGMPTLTIDPLSNVSSITYDSDGVCPYEVQHPVISGVSHIEYNVCDHDTGLLTQHYDFNSQETVYSYDALRRLTGISYPDGGSVSYDYSGDSATPNPYFTFTQAITSAQNFVQKGTVDGLARPAQTRTTVPTTTCSGGYSYVVTTYDNEARQGSVSNPECTSSPSDPTSYLYDALNRVTKITDPDGSYVSNSYSGSYITTTDEAGKKREIYTDGLGRTSKIWEDPSSSNYETDYSYSPNNDLLCVAENTGGSFTNCSSMSSTWRPRRFYYDFQSHLTSSYNPEISSAGTACQVSYTYDANGNRSTKNAPAPNQTSCSTTVTTTNSYDALNRILSKSYSDGTTPTAYFSYDQSGYTYPIGTLTSEGTYLGGWINATGFFNHDQMGRPFLQYQYQTTTSWVPWEVAYSYNLAGGISAYTDGSGTTFTQTPDITANVSQVTSSWSDFQHPGTLVSGVQYNPGSQITAATFGNGLTVANWYNNRYQPCRMNTNSTATTLTACTGSAPSGNVLDLQTGYGSSNNDDIVTWSATGAQTFTRTYSPYDGINRLATMSDSASGATCTGLSWSYDAWGNRTAQTVTGGTCNPWSQSYNSANHITGTGYSYDAAGNITNDGSHSYTHDAENRLIQVDSGSTASYVYDAEGRRVQKTSGGATTEYVYDLSGNVTADFEGSTLETDYIYLNSRLTAEYAGGTTYFVHSDHLGSTRLITALNQSVCFNADYYPFGEQTPITSSCSTTHLFTGKERDAESNLDNFDARYYSSAQGRLMSPDPENAGADPTNPQSWNMYSYALNNPLSLIDPTGEYTCVYLTDDGNSIDTTDDNSSPEECADNGGYEGVPEQQITVTSNDGGCDPSSDANSCGIGSDSIGSPQSPGKQNLFTCAAGIGDKLSIAGGLHALGIGTSGIGGFITDALGGNAFSGATNLVASFGSGAAGGHNVFYNMAQGVVSGPGQGVLPPGINGPWGASASGLATDAIAKTAWSSITGAGQTLTTLGGEASLASTAITAAEFASGVAEAKYAYDALSYAAGLFVCAAK